MWQGLIVGIPPTVAAPASPFPFCEHRPGTLGISSSRFALLPVALNQPHTPHVITSARGRLGVAYVYAGVPLSLNKVLWLSAAYWRYPTA